MLLVNLLKSAAGTCPFCSQKAGILSREHPDCRPDLPGRLERDRQARLRRRQVARVPREFPPGLADRNSQALIRRCQYNRTGNVKGLEKGAQTRRSGREHHSRRGIQTPEVPGQAGTEPDQRPRLCNGTTEPDIQAEAHRADPSRRHHCRRRRPTPETTLKSSPEGRVRVGGIVHTGVHTSVVKAAAIREIAEDVVPPEAEHPGPDSVQPYEVGDTGTA